MLTRRKEPFRYSITPPMICWLEIKEIDQVPLKSKLAEVDLINISKSGCRIRTGLNLYASAHEIQANIHMKLSEDLHIFNGQVRWQKEVEPAVFDYGISLQLDVSEKETINAELRTLAGSRRIIVN